MVELEILSLENNKIADIKPLENRCELRDLELNGNNISTIPLSVTRLDIAIEKIMDYLTFEALKEKPKAMTCNLGYSLEFGGITFRLDEFDSFYDTLDILEIYSFDDDLL